jgi:two-component system nitrogen regulation response regulator GlnG
MQDVFRRAIKANRFDDLPVLIEGEHGTPKRRLASAILALDPSRVRMPLFALHCDGLDGLLETLAALSVQNNRTVAGQWDELLRTAQGGAVYLEEIGSLDRELQQALLAFVRRRPGAVRVIAATERPVQELVSAGRLDARLAAWLGLFRIPLPSLRGRPDDIAAQARHVLQSAAAGSAGPVTEFGPGVLAVLERLPWEGNTRQLEEVLRQALAMKRDGGPLRLDDLPAWARKVSLDAELPEPVPHPGDWMDEVQGETGGPLDSAADQYERGLLRTLVGRHASADMDAVRPDHQVQGR